MSTVVVIKSPPTLLVVRIFRMDVGNSIVEADPFVAMVVSSHTIIEHVPSLLDELGQMATCGTVFGVLAYVVHH